METNILFRAWDDKEKRMLYVDEFSSSWGTVDSKGNISDIPCFMTWSGDLFLQVEDGKYQRQPHITLLQYCKSKDINGKKIFQGDIIKEKHEGQTPESEEYYRVVYNVVISNEVTVFPAEVVGNIYENPELAISLAGKIK